ncbi:MAG TPA: hypothetical protein VGL66_08210 [Caulobacteraceae bacterium]|jgi:hypothetical protein
MEKATGAGGPIFHFIHQGFDTVRTDILAIVIALIVVFALMKRWGQLIVMTIAATVIHLLIAAFAVPLIDKHPLVIPDVMAPSYWMMALSLLVGYLIMIIVLFFLKNNVFKMGKSSGGGH